MSDAVFEPLADDRFKAGELSRGPWDPDAQHGGAPAALLMRAFERLANRGDGLMLARVTYEFLRPVPLQELVVTVELTRPGRRAQLLEGTISNGSGDVVVRARALRVVRTDIQTGPDADPGPRASPDAGRTLEFPGEGQPMFSTHAMEIRFVEGAFLEVGPAAAWFRLRAPLLSGEAPSSLQQLAAAADFGNGISSAVSWDEHVFINPDLTIYLEREPDGHWICLQSVTRIGANGIGVAESVLYDESGRVGRAIQALVVASRSRR